MSFLGRSWVGDLFSTRKDYTEGFVYQSRILQYHREHAESEVDEPGIVGDDESSNRTRELPSLFSSKPSDRLSKEAPRRYLQMLRSAVLDSSLHTRIIESDFLKTLHELQNDFPDDSFICSLCLEVLCLLCHVEEEILRNDLVKMGAIQALANFGATANRLLEAVPEESAKLCCSCASALVCLSVTEKAPRILAQNDCFDLLHQWGVKMKSVTMGDLLHDLLFNTAIQLPRSHCPYWIDGVLTAACRSLKLNSADDETTVHHTLVACDALARMAQVKGICKKLVQMGVFDHCFTIFDKWRRHWAQTNPHGFQHLQVTCAAFLYTLSCANEAITRICLLQEERVLPFIEAATLASMEPWDHACLCACVATYGNIGRAQNLRTQLLQANVVDLLRRVVEKGVAAGDMDVVILCAIALSTLSSDDDLVPAPPPDER